MTQTSNWYLIYTKAFAEKRVFQSLVDDGYEVFFPLVNKSTI